MPDNSISFTFRVDPDLLTQFQALASEEYSNASVEIRRLMKQAIHARLQDTLDGSL